MVDSSQKAKVSEEDGCHRFEKFRGQGKGGAESMLAKKLASLAQMFRSSTILVFEDDLASRKCSKYVSGPREKQGGEESRLTWHKVRSDAKQQLHRG